MKEARCDEEEEEEEKSVRIVKKKDQKSLEPHVFQAVEV
jgi:hypothetical protein